MIFRGDRGMLRNEFRQWAYLAANLTKRVGARRLLGDYAMKRLRARRVLGD